MPQMMPLSWTTLYLYFIIILFTFLFINYYSYIPILKTKKKSLSPKSINWKW
uniref:ATP synthase F0 subunit 8 n=1 Tax=Salganea incerta TaxID=112978 RepID=UPI0027A894F2|nr:ATP synthase F0 subunit 8 [Salganea incerta]WGO57655.1 ATP synthase F0 subunit 8 [Salganea incerta]